MTEPQTLAKQIRAMEPQEANGRVNPREAWEAARNQAAALADAAATTTPAAQAGDVRQAVPEWGTSDKAQHYAAMVTDTNDADILRAAIIDLCRDNERLAVMLKSAKQPDPTPPTALSGPPKDGRMLCLLVDYSDGDHPLEDAKQAWTIGYNTLADTGDDEWLIAGWSWEQDCYTDGRGTVIGWLPFPCDPTPALSWKAMQTAAAEAVAKEAHGETVLGGQRFKTVKLEDAVDAILALPGPTDAHLLAEAAKLAAVQELVGALKHYAEQYCEGFCGDLPERATYDLSMDMQCGGCKARAALAKIGGAA